MPRRNRPPPPPPTPPPPPRGPPRPPSPPVSPSQRGPLAARPIRALRQPASRRRGAEQAAVFLATHRQLQPDALVAGEERQIAVRGRRPDALEAAPLLQAS